MKQQKSTLFVKLNPIFVQTTKILKKTTSNDLCVETKRYLKRNWGKSVMKFIEVTTKLSKFLNFRYFRQHSPPFLRPFRIFISIRKTIGS